MYYIDRKKLHTDILKRLNEIEKPQRYLEKRINISRATIYRLLKKDANLDFSTFFKLIDWLSEEPETYIKLKKMKNRKFDIKKDFQELNEMENEIMPLIDKMNYQNALNEKENQYKKDLLKNYVRTLFTNQFKN